jgi:CIC family chloride channel protein
VVAEDFVIALDTNILNTIITRMNRRRRSLAIIVDGKARVPRPEDVLGVIAAAEISSAVIANHYA